MISLPKRRTSASRALLAAGLLATGLGAAGSVAAAAIPSAFDARFAVDHSGLPLGNAQFTLSAGDESGCWIYRGRANPNALAQMFLGNITDESRFCMVDGQVRPQHFSHHIDGDADKSYTLAFDWDGMQATYDSETGEHDVYPLKAGTQDPLSLQFAARRWVAAAADPATLDEKTFQMIDDDGVEPYGLAASDGGTIKTPAGRYATLKVARTGDHSHALAFWLAPDADWIPVRVRQIKDGSTAFTMTMKRLKREP